MSEAVQDHRLVGLEPDNLLGVLALLGLLRALECARADWRPRVSWDVERSPVRPTLHLRVPQTRSAVARAGAEGVTELSKDHEFDRPKLGFSPEEAADRLGRVAIEADRRSREKARLWSALISDAAIRDKKEFVERTPFCLLDVAQTAFLKNLGEIALPSSTPRVERKQLGIGDTLEAALFYPWTRGHNTTSFRWDPMEDSRHALRWAAPTDEKQGVEHGANVLAALGLRSLTVVPRQKGSDVRLAVVGGRFENGFSFAWPIWRERMSLSAIEALLGHPDLRTQSALSHLGVCEVRVARKFNPNGGKYSNFGTGRDSSMEEANATAPSVRRARDKGRRDLRRYPPRRNALTVPFS